MKSIAICLFALLLSGCADRLAGWIAYEGDLAARGRAYVDERHRVRQEIRRRCEGLLWAEIDRLQARLAENAQSLAGLEQRETNIRDEFKKQLDRYRFLVERETEESAGR